MAEEWPGVDFVRLDRTPNPQAGRPLRTEQTQRGNFGCGCLFVIAIVIGVAGFLAIAHDADFPGADYLRKAGAEVSQRLGGEDGERIEQPLRVADPTPTLQPASSTSDTPHRSVEPSPTPVLGNANQPHPTQQITSAPSSAPVGGNRPTPTLRQMPTNTPGALSTAATQPSPNLRHHDAKLYMLELINAERARVGVPPVTLGDNIAAQLHAENALSGCFSSHWGLDGLKPYMRYSLAGGYQTNAENGSGLDYCIKASERYAALGSTESEIREMMDGWMRSPGHRSNILDRWHKTVNIGLAWDRYNLFGYQQFEGGYVDYGQVPEIANGTLSFKGRTLGEFRFSNKEEMGLQLYYDPPPHALTRGQVSRTYCYDSGLLIAAFRYPLTGGWFWDEHEFTKTHSPCPDPYDVPTNAPGPRSPGEAHRFWQQASSTSSNKAPQLITVPWITAQKWTARDTDFSVAADIGDLLSEYGPGVYTILLWGEIGGEDVPVSQYSIFHQTEPPDTYDPDHWK